jgi:superfamily II DNA or RNA helicase
LPIEHTKIDGCPKKVAVVMANQLYVPINPLPSVLVSRLKRVASFGNPVFFKTQAMRFSTNGIPRYICCSRIEQDYLVLPRGSKEEMEAILAEQNISVEYDDKRQSGEILRTIKFRGELKPEQKKAVSALTKEDTGVLHAPTAFGKTVTAIGLITKRKVNTLILVNSRHLLDQWKERLSVFVEGVDIGVMGGGKKKPTKQIDVATYQTFINKKDNFVDPDLLNYGQVIIDECHHVSAPSFELILSEVRAKYVLGLTATPERQDGHQRIIFMQAGPIRHRAKGAENNTFEQQVILRQNYDNPPLEISRSEQRPNVADVYRWLMHSEDRNQNIINDVISEIDKGRNPLVLTERREHAEMLDALLSEKGFQALVLKGGNEG